MTKGMAVGQLAKIIIAIAVLLLLLEISLTLINKTDYTASIARCKTDIYKAAIGKIGKARFSENIACPTIDIRLKDTAAIKVHEKLAKQMLSCWQTFGQGKLELFSDEGVYCHICSKTSFETAQKVTGFNRFFFNAKAEKGKTYAQAVSPRAEYTQEDVLRLSETNDEINTAKQYAISYIYLRGKEGLQATLAKAGAYTGSVILVGIGINTGGILLPVSIAGASALSSLASLYEGDVETVQAVQLTEYAPDALDALGCTSEVST